MMECMKRTSTYTSFLLLLLTVVACGGEGDADVAGSWTLSLTNRDNGCNFSNWTTGKTESATLDLMQSGTDVTGPATGWTQLTLKATLGNDYYSGTVSGSHVALTLSGHNALTQGNCSYFINATLAGDVSGNTMNGRTDYKPQTNHDPDCDYLETCTTYQDFSASRPPPP